GQLTCLVQHEFFHRYTADEHTLVCIDKLDALARTEDPKLIQYRKLFEELPNPFVLYLALLLHDTGKAVGARPHSEASAVFAQRVARRLQLDPGERKMLILLVDHHVTLSNIAQRRNIDDPVTVSEFAAIVKDQKNLDALMLLTLADGQGTSDEGWSDWKETLVWQLYHATSQYLADRHSFYERAKTAREARETSVQVRLGPDYADEIEAHFEFMPAHYFRAFDFTRDSEHFERRYLHARRQRCARCLSRERSARSRGHERARDGVRRINIEKSAGGRSFRFECAAGAGTKKRTSSRGSGVGISVACQYRQPGRSIFYIDRNSDAGSNWIAA